MPRAWFWVTVKDKQCILMLNMDKKIKGWRRIGFFRAAVPMLIMGLMLPAPAAAVDITSIFGDIQFRYGSYDGDVKDWVADVESVSGEQRSVSRVFRRGDRFRIETVSPTAELPPDAESLAAIHRTQIYDGHDLWSLGEPGKAPEKQTLGAAPELAMWQDWWKYLDGGASLEALEDVDGIDCLVIAVTPSALFPRSRLWVDKREFRLLKAQGLNEDGKEITWLYSDYRAQGDWKFPFKIEIKISGEPFAFYRVRAMRLNKNLTDETFRLPGTTVPAGSA